MIYFSFVQGDVTSVAHPTAQERGPALTRFCSVLRPQPVRTGCRYDQEDRKWLSVKELRTRRAPGHPSHDTGANSNIPGGSRFTFYTDPWEVSPGNQLTLLKLELLSDSKFFTISTRGPQDPIRERKDEPGKRETEAPFPPKTNWIALRVS